MPVLPLARALPGQVRDSVQAFRAVLALPRVRPLAAASAVARLPKGMMPLAMVLLVRQSAGSYALAGAAAALMALGDAVSAPAQGRMADRFGRARVLVPSAALHVAAVAAVLALARHGTPPGALMASACLAGVGMPPVSGSIKAAWPQLVPPAALPAAYAMESLLQQVVFLAGPLLVSAIAAAADPAAAMACSAGLAVIGTVSFAAAAARAALARPGRHGQRARGALRVRAVRLLAGCTLLHGLAFGALPVGLAAAAAAAGLPDLAGPLLATLTAGGVAGTLGPITPPGGRRYARLSAGFAATLLAAAAASLAPSAGSLAATGAALAAAGLFVTPIAATSYVLTEAATAATHRTEAFTWLSTGQALGTAAGAAVAGVLASAFGPAAALAVMPAAAGLAALAARTWLPAGSPGREEHEAAGGQPPG